MPGVAGAFLRTLPFLLPVRLGIFRNPGLGFWGGGGSHVCSKKYTMNAVPHPQAWVWYGSVRTLDSSKLVQRQQPVLDLSGTKLRNLHVIRTFKDSVSPSLCRVRVSFLKSKGLTLPFPPNTRGVFYYNHDPALPPASGTIRFRLCDPSEFSKGRDLETRPGHPWTIPLANVTNSRMRGFGDLLVQEGLITDDLRKDVVKWDPIKACRTTHRLYDLQQPFRLSLSEPCCRVRFITERARCNISFSEMFKDHSSWRSPFRGVVSVRFEPALSAGERSDSFPVVLRILETITPIAAVDPGYMGFVVEPQAGEVYSKRKRGGRIEPWVIDLAQYRAVTEDILAELVPPGLNIDPAACTRRKQQKPPVTFLRPRPERFLKTLDPSMLVDKGQARFDFAGIKEVHVNVHHDGSLDTRNSIRMPFSRQFAPFPTDTQGFLYYNRAAGSPSADGLRFRICEGPSQFAVGRDLEVAPGQPWQIPLSKFRRFQTFQPVCTLLLQEGLVTSELLEH